MCISIYGKLSTTSSYLQLISHQNTNTNVDHAIHEHYFNHSSHPLSYFTNFFLISVSYHMSIFLWDGWSIINKE